MLVQNVEWNANHSQCVLM